jgi:hypothetical protein
VGGIWKLKGLIVAKINKISVRRKASIPWWRFLRVFTTKLKGGFLSMTFSKWLVIGILVAISKVFRILFGFVKAEIFSIHRPPFSHLNWAVLIFFFSYRGAGCFTPPKKDQLERLQ